jgi:FAD/FMN-containing dehydrogenase/uncharacterized short protein YbdD (DUF466 family)
MNFKAYAFFALFLSWVVHSSVVVNDVTQINPVLMKNVFTPTSITEIQNIIKQSKGPISIGGGRYSMGGQTAIDNGIQLDMRRMNKIINIDKINKKITVQSGIRWRDIQDAIDPLNLSIKIMQTYSNFTVGGSLSVNVHGRYIGQGPIIRSVDSIKVVLANGELLKASSNENSDIFYGAIGGYGGIGVIVEATLQLTDNIKLIRQVDEVKTSDYQNYFKQQIRNNPEVILHNGDLYPPHFETLRAINWKKTDEPLTVTERLIPRNQEYWLQPKAVSVISSIPKGTAIRSKIIDPLIYEQKMVVWKNYEASYDVAELEPASREKSTYVLQEYFIPVKHFDDFIPKMRKVFNDHKVNVINVSIRHALPDPGSLLAWAPEEVFCFVAYIKQDTTPDARVATGDWTREMATQILSVNGRWYLPYQVHATDAQIQKAYSRFMEYYELKKRVDPDYRLQNKLIEKYYTPLPASILTSINQTPSYKRDEVQSFLALPEWYAVFNSDEYAAHMANKNPSDFPYWQSTKEFWSLYSKIIHMTEKKYPLHIGDKARLWIIGTNFSAGLILKGLWENTIGKLTESPTSKNRTTEDKMIANFHKEYGDFIQVKPWVEFPFWSKVKDLWFKTDFFGENFIRKIERKLWFSVEFGFKASYAALIRWRSSTVYGADLERIHMVVQGNDVLKLDGVKKIHSQGNVHFVSTPRYDVLKDLLVQNANSEFKIIEISGNKTILFTIIGPKGLRPETLKNYIVGDSKVVTEEEKERLLIAGPVSALLVNLKAARENGYVVDHLFDY